MKASDCIHLHTHYTVTKGATLNADILGGFFFQLEKEEKTMTRFFVGQKSPRCEKQHLQLSVKNDFQKCLAALLKIMSSH